MGFEAHVYEICAETGDVVSVGTPASSDGSLTGGNSTNAGGGAEDVDITASLRTTSSGREAHQARRETLVFHRWTNYDAEQTAVAGAGVGQVDIHIDVDKPDGDAAPAEAKQDNYVDKDNVVVLIFHGLHTHGQFPTVKYFAEALLKLRLLDSSNGGKKRVTVYSVDLPGHGSAKGTHGLIRSAPSCIDHAFLATRFVYCLERDRCLRRGAQTSDQNLAKPGACLLPALFLAGTSMGAGVALGVALRNEQEPVAASANLSLSYRIKKQRVPVTSLLLAAPFLGAHDKDIPNLVVYNLLWALSYVAPSLALITTKAGDPTLQYRDEKRRQECLDDEKQYNGKLRLGSAASLLTLSEQNRQGFARLRTPFLILAPENEHVVDGSKCEVMMRETTSVSEEQKSIRDGVDVEAELQLHGVFFLALVQQRNGNEEAETSASTSYSMIVIRDALHGLFCEPEEGLAVVRAELEEWIGKRLMWS